MNRLIAWFQSPLRWLKAAAIFVGGVLMVLSARRYLGKKTRARKRGDATRSVEKSGRAYAKAIEHHNAAQNARDSAERQIVELASRGHLSMAEKLERLNDI